MKNITAARAEFEALEGLGWEFGDIYEDVAAAQGVTSAEAEAWQKKNYHVIVTVEPDGATYYQICHNNTLKNFESDRWETGDDAKTMRDLASLLCAGKLWDVK